MELAFAGLHDLCSPLLGQLDSLPDPQRSAISSALGLTAGVSPDKFLVAVGALGSQSGRTPVVVTEEMISNMRPGSVIIDVSIDRGGCFETSEITSHEQPIFMKYGVIHYCVPNIPSGFARTASQAISNVLMPLLLEAGEEGGFENLVWHKVHLRSGIYLFKGALTNFHLSQRFDLKYTDLNLLIASQR